MKRNKYLNMKSLEAARSELLDRFDWIGLVGTRTVDTAEALGRITAEPVFAVLSSPYYQAAAMDGIAVAAESTYGASDESPITLEVNAGAWFVNTGQVLPESTDAVVMIEQLHQPSPDKVEIRAAAFPWQHVRRVGEDMVAGEMLLPHHHRLGATDVAALLAAGVFSLEVLQRPRVTILPTGSELVDWREARRKPPAPGVIIEFNSVLLSGLVTEAGGVPTVWPRQPDDPEKISAALTEALATDTHLVLLNAGASAGSKDYTVHILGEVGRVLTHGVTAMPGKPSILGEAKGKPVVGTPGYPVSAWVCFDQLVRPALERMQGQPPRTRDTVEVVATRSLASKLGQEEFLRVHLGQVGDRVVATPLKRGAGTVTSLTRADGILRIPAGSEGTDQDRPIEAELLPGRMGVHETLVITGSHDITLDLLADHMKHKADWIRVSASNVGSLGGLMALGAGQCHVGGTHLLDPATGEYNVSYLRQHLSQTPARLVTLALRQQGLIVKKGNPKSIRTFADLTRDDVRMINRQAGSGTRVLLDYYLDKESIAPEQLAGYDHDEYTHTGVAVQVLAGGADVGLGILAAARSLNLDFVPLMIERYDLCIPHAHWDDPRIRVLRETLTSPAFKKSVDALGGYDVTPMGDLAWEG
jgi:molybdopterin molybdotransferase/putative molybdopterin biosynthesis protein